MFNQIPDPRQMATAALDMLTKATLVGADVPTYVGVHNWLEAIREGHLTVSARPEPEIAPTPEQGVEPSE